MRKEIGERSVFIDQKNVPLKWNYTKNLHELHETEVLNLAKRLRKLLLNLIKRK